MSMRGNALYNIADHPTPKIDEKEVAYTLESRDYKCPQVVAYRGDAITSPVNASNPQPGDPCHTLTDDSRNYVVKKTVYDWHRQDTRMTELKDVCVTAAAGWGAGGNNMPYVLEGEVKNARTQDTILRILQETYGEKEIIQWGIDIMASLQQAEVLRQGVHESSIQGETKEGNKLDDNTLPCPTDVTEWIMRDMREQSERGCSPQGWESTEQFIGELAEIMPELPCESTQASKTLFDMWRQGKRIRLLQQTLHQIQEIRQPFMGEWEGGDLMDGVGAVVRRLTPL